MADPLGGRTVLTSKPTIFAYYILCLVSFFFSGLPVLMALVGAIMSGRLARQEGAPVAAAHCSWIARSIGMSLLLALLVLVAAYFMLSLSGVQIPETTPGFDTLEEFWADPAMRIATSYIVSVGLAFLCIGVWFVYRVVRGVCKLAYALPPTGSVRRLW